MKKFIPDKTHIRALSFIFQKKYTLLLVAIIVLNLSSYSQTEFVPLDQVRKIAERNAAALWGGVSPAEPIAYYAANDELIGYRFNYAIGKSFPPKDQLILQCDEAYKTRDKKSQWGIGSYGNMLVSARKDIGVIQDYSDALSPEYSMGSKMEKLAKQSLGKTVWLKKVYFVNFENQWFCYTNGSNDIYINVFPGTQVMSEAQFREITHSLDYFCAKGDFSEEWDAYQNSIPLASKSAVWIPYPENCKFYDWSYGCTPTAAAMLLSWWDYNSINTDDNYSRLVDYYFQRWDTVQDETDYQVPNLQWELAYEMHTDTTDSLSGITHWEDIEPGYTEVCNLNNYNQYNFNITFHYDEDFVWYFNKIISEIGTHGRPVANHIEGHSECCVAYDEATNMIGVHNTWWEGVQWINRNQLVAVHTVVAGGALGLGITLEHPLGDNAYNHNGDGEVFMAGDACEIRWDYDIQQNSYAKLTYSQDGGFNWTYITQNTPNDGVFDWHIPNGLNSSACRILISLFTADDEFAGADASLGNFIINPGGYIQQLQQDIIDYTESDPDYYNLWHGYTTWCAVGVRAYDDAEWWGIEMFDDDSFDEQLAESYFLSRVEFVVMDGHHSTLNKAIKVNRLIGEENGTVEFEGEDETLSLGVNSLSWPSFDVVEMFDVHLVPDEYTFILGNNIWGPNLDFALFGSNGAAYYADRQDFLAMSENPGTMDEVFTIEILTEDDYGLCVWANDSDNGSYTIRIENRETWTGEVSSDWFETGNWSLNYVPDEYTDVIIPAGTPFQPVISDAIDIAYSKNITIEAGAVLTQEGNLLVYGNFNSEGQFTLNGDIYSYLAFKGSYDTYWDDTNGDDTYTNIVVEKSVNSARVEIMQNTTCNGGFNISEGIVTIGNNRTLVINSTDADAFILWQGGKIILANGTIDVAGGIIFSDGSSEEVTGGTIRCGGDFIVENNATCDITFTGGTLVMNGSETQNITDLDDGNTQLNNLTINKAGICNVGNDILNVNGTLQIDEGKLSFIGHTVNCGGDVNIMNGGKIKIDDRAILRIGQNHALSVNNGGILQVVGDSQDNAMISVLPEGTGYYSFDVNDGGIISARRATFERMDANGVNIHEGAEVDPANSFDYCIFRDGITGIAALLVIQNNQNIAIIGADFPDNTWGGLVNVSKSNNEGHVMMGEYSGLFSGPDYEFDPFNLLDWNILVPRFNFRIMLEGPFNGTGMDAMLNGILPLDHSFNPSLPYYGNSMPDWYYTGIESVISIPNTDIVDWVLIEFRDAPSVQQALPATAIEKRVALVDKTGQIVTVDGVSLPPLTFDINYNLYVAIFQKNHLGIISAYPLVETNGLISYDFTTDPIKAFGGTEALKELAPGIWAMRSGDGDGNGIIDDADKINAWDLQAGSMLCYGSDFNLDNQVNNADKNDFWEPNHGYFSFIPEFLSFNCGDALTDTRDGQNYTTVQIGTQCWMAENLNIGTMVLGAAELTNNGILEKYCYENTPANCDVYGGLYQWAEMVQYLNGTSNYTVWNPVPTGNVKGICPNDWHIPTDMEWKVLEGTVDSQYGVGHAIWNNIGWRGFDVASNLKEAGALHWYSPNVATNSSGFTALPGGVRTGGSTFSFMPYNGYFWSSTEDSANYTWYRYMGYGYGVTYRNKYYKTWGKSVRCLRD